jgi:hypothetical protein
MHETASTGYGANVVPESGSGIGVGEQDAKAETVTKLREKIRFSAI